MDEPIIARYEREGGQWTARSLVAGREVVAVARTLPAARSAFVTEAASVLGTYAPHLVVQDDIVLPDACTSAVVAARHARAVAMEAAARSQETLRTAARVLVEHDLSYRDAAYVLGISHPRIQQVVGKESART